MISDVVESTPTHLLRNSLGYHGNQSHGTWHGAGSVLVGVVLSSLTHWHHQCLRQP